MSNQPYSPEELARELDRLLENDLPVTDNPLLESARKFTQSSPPELSPGAFKDIQSSMLQFNQQLRFAALRQAVSMAAGVIVTAGAIIMTILYMTGDDESATQSTPLNEPSVTVAPVTATQPATEKPSPTYTLTPEFTATTEATPTATVTPSITQTPTKEATPGRPVVMIIEGPIEAISDESITIFAMEIQIDPDDAITETLEIGDYVRVEAISDNESDPTTMQLFASTITPIEETPNSSVNNATPVPGAIQTSEDVYINESTGEVYVDDGTCNNPPPNWAPAHGWRQRCEGGPPPGAAPPGQNQDDNGGRPDTPGNSGNNPGQGNR